MLKSGKSQLDRFKEAARQCRPVRGSSQGNDYDRLSAEIQVPLRDPVRFVKAAAMGRSTAPLPYLNEMLAHLQNRRGAEGGCASVHSRRIGKLDNNR